MTYLNISNAFLARFNRDFYVFDERTLPPSLAIHISCTITVHTSSNNMKHFQQSPSLSLSPSYITRKQKTNTQVRHVHAPIDQGVEHVIERSSETVRDALGICVFQTCDQDELGG